MDSLLADVDLDEINSEDWDSPLNYGLAEVSLRV